MARTVLRAGLFVAGVVGGYLLLSLIASPAHAGPAEGGVDLGGLVGDGGLVDDLTAPVLQPPDEPQAPAAAVEPLADPVVDLVTEPVAETVVAPVTDTVTEPVVETVVAPAATAVAPLVETTGDSLDELVAGVGGTVQSTVDPLTSTVDSVLPQVAAPMVDDITDQPLLGQPLLDPPLSLPPLPPTGPVPVVTTDPATPLSIATPQTAAPVVADRPAEPPAAPPSPLLAQAFLAPAGQPPAAAASAAAAGGGGEDPRPARSPAPPPVSTSHHLAGDSFDPGHPWPWTGLPDPAHEPDPGRLRSLEDIASSGLVMSISAPPG